MTTRQRTQAGRTLWPVLPLLLHIIPGCFSIYGPQSVRGPRGGLVTIRCYYDSGWETYGKWWCRGEAWASCKILVKTTESEQVVQRGRVSIQDDPWGNVFTVTMQELSEDDEDTYWCGIEKSGTDLGHQVQVFIGPAANPTNTSVLSTTNMAIPMSTRMPEPATTYMFEPVTTDTAKPATTDIPETVATDTAEPVTAPPASLASSPPVTQGINSSVALTSPLTRFLLCKSFMLLIFIKVALLGGLLCTVMWLSRCQRDSRRQ